MPDSFAAGFRRFVLALRPSNHLQGRPFYKKSWVLQFVSVRAALFALGFAVLVLLSLLIYDSRFLEDNEHYGWDFGISFPLMNFIIGYGLFWLLVLLRKCVVGSLRIMLAVVRPTRVDS